MLADDLRTLGGRYIEVLIEAANEGRITELVCAMDVCRCPLGRTHFEPRGKRSRWAPSVDRYPVAGRDGGEYVTTNVRLAHAHCNQSAGAAVTAMVRRANGSYRTEAMIESGRRLGQQHGAGAIKRWRQTPEAKEMMAVWGRKVGLTRKGQPSPPKSPGALARQRRNLDAWMATPEAHDFFVRNGAVSSCVRWNLKRGKPCTCGAHATASAAR